MKVWQQQFTVEGLNIERFLRQAGDQGIALSGVRRAGARRLTALAWADDLTALQEICLRGGWCFAAQERTGLGRSVTWMYRRWMLAGGILTALVIMALASQVMWRIELVDAGTYTADIQAALLEWEIQPPMLRRQISLAELRDMLEWRYPDVAWFECGWRGMTLVIRAVDGVAPDAPLTHMGAGDVIAHRDGIVTSIQTKAGTPQVEIGDLVRKGDVLIRGEERTSDGALRTVAARGIVLARTWEAAAIRMPATETQTVYTGQTQTVWTVSCPWFQLWPLPESGFEQQDIAVDERPVGGFFLPLTLRTETRMEAECVTVMRDLDELYADAQAAALRKLAEKSAFGDSPVDKWVNCSMIEDEILLAVAYGEYLVDIGEQIRHDSGMAATE
ncbi:MAG: sporulation protein YqfD [Clostridia bacterium]|nr:sporulation protein YqfD [Clostridia bacterium]